jgi:hypothetical protein
MVKRSSAGKVPEYWAASFGPRGRQKLFAAISCPFAAYRESSWPGLFMPREKHATDCTGQYRSARA